VHIEVRIQCKPQTLGDKNGLASRLLQSADQPMEKGELDQEIRIHFVTAKKVPYSEFPVTDLAGVNTECPLVVTEMPLECLFKKPYQFIHWNPLCV